MDITQIIDDSCFIRVVWSNNDSDNLNKTDVKFHLSGNDVFISDNSGYFQRLDYTKITSPAVASASLLRDAIKTFADTNPCSGGGGAAWGSITGTIASQTDLVAALAEKEDVANKVTDLSSNSNTFYPTVKAVNTGLNDVIALIPVVACNTYTPTYVAASSSNLASNPTFDDAQYMAITDPTTGLTVVTVSGDFIIDPILTATATGFKFTLPIATTGTGSSSIRGTAANSINDSGILLSFVDGYVSFAGTPIGISSQKWSFQFTYSVN